MKKKTNMSGVNRLVLADSNGTTVPTNEALKEEAVECATSTEEMAEHK